MSDGRTIRIVRLGRDGDGAADGPDGPIFIADALPGEVYERTGVGPYARIGDVSPERIAPVCRHFGSCGGCVGQHMAPDTYRRWKEGLIVSAFKTQGLDIQLQPLLVVTPGSRRRAALSAIVTGERVKLGYHERRSHALIDLDQCPVLDDRIVEALPALREIVRRLGMATKRAKQAALEVRLEVAALSGGLDVAVHSEAGPPSIETAAHLAILARRARLARLTVDELTICAEGVPQLMTAAGPITPPPGGFFQASAVAEQAMVDLISRGLGSAKRVADLFCGSGTFTLPIAQKSRVTGFDSDVGALAALQAAARAASGLKPIETRRRELLGEPLSPLELADFDAVVFDPPRAGAKAQCEMLAKSKIRTVVAVSCNPATLARDCRILVDAGFDVGPVHGIDQFLWSTHVEAVTVLTRKKTR